jgi:chromosomal replication initiation ATPase DnaA
LIFGGPGWGKTTFLHHIFRFTMKRDDLLPVLISLRRPTAVEDLERFVNACARIQKKQRRACTLLLVDGYDEISTDQRRRVSEALLQFQAHGAGKFVLMRSRGKIRPVSLARSSLHSVRFDRLRTSWSANSKNVGSRSFCPIRCC